MEHTATLCGQSVPQRTQYISTTEPKRLMLFEETGAVYCENHTEHRYIIGQTAEFYYVKASGT
jgi:hypothetical protein